jgi:hypothetical protein
LLRSWLACGAPIVEANVEGLAKPVGGTVGDQFPACGDGIDAEPTFDNFYEIVIVESGCIGNCHEPGDHAGAEDFDLSSPAVAYASLMGADGMGGAATDCDDNPNPMVTANDPEKSYFYTKVGGEAGPLCRSPMPFGSEFGLPSAELDFVRRWIEAGAPGPGASVGDGGTSNDEEMDGGT